MAYENTPPSDPNERRDYDDVPVTATPPHEDIDSTFLLKALRSMGRQAADKAEADLVARIAGGSRKFVEPMQVPAAKEVDTPAHRQDELIGFEDEPDEPKEQPQKLLHVHALRVTKNPEVEGSEKDTVDFMPNRDVVRAAVLGGEELTLVANLRVDPGGRVSTEFLASSPLIPNGASVSAPPRAGTERGEAAAPPPSECNAFVRLRAVRIPEKPDQAPRPGPSEPTGARPEGLRLDGLLDRGFDTDMQIVVQGTPVPKDMWSDIGDEIDDQVHNKGQRRSAMAEAAALGVVGGIVDDAHMYGLVDRRVAVGVTDPSRILDVAQLAAAAGFKSDQKVAWQIDTNPDGSVTVYPDAKSALAREDASPKALVADRDALISGDQFALEALLPHQRTPGLEHTSEESFAPNRFVPPGVPAITMGDIVYKGKIAAELKLPVADMPYHGAIIGGTGSGKTVLEKALILESLKEAYAQFSAEGGIKTPYGVVVIDMQKKGNFDDLAAQLAGAGLPPDWATIRRITTKGEVVGNVNPLRLVGDNTPKDQIPVIIMALAVKLVEPAAVTTFEKFMKPALELAYWRAGWDVENGVPRFPFSGKPPTPDMEMVAACIDEVIAKEGYQDKTGSDLKGFVRTTFTDIMSLKPGELYTGADAIDYDKIIDLPGVTVLELGGITDPDMQAIALTLVFQGLTSALEARQHGDVKRPELLVYLDEAGRAFRKTPTGEYNAHVLTHVRGSGMGVILGFQGGWSGLAGSAHDNLNNIWATHSNNPNDMRDMNDRFGIPRASTALQRMEPGEGLYLGLRMPDGPVEFRTRDPETIPQGEGTVDSNPQEILDKGEYSRHYSPATQRAARRLITEEDIGVELRGVIELNTYLTVTGHELATIQDDPNDEFENLKTKLQGVDRETLDCAIERAAQLAVFARPEVGHAMDPRELLRFIVADTQAQLFDQPRPYKDPFALQLNIGKYSRLEDLLEHNMMAPAIEDPKYTRALGEIAGAVAPEQLSNLKNLEEESVQQLAEIITSSKGLTPELLSVALDEARKLVGDMPADKIEAHIAAMVGQQLDAVASDTLRTIASCLPEYNDELDALARSNGMEPVPRLSYADMRADLQASEKVYQERGPLDLRVWEVHYGEEFPGNTAAEQLDSVRLAKRRHIAKTGYVVEEEDMLFAPDPINPGHTLDVTTGYFVHKSLPHGSMIAEQEALLNGGMAPRYTYGATLRRGDDRASVAWGVQIGNRLLMSAKVRMPTIVSRGAVKLTTGRMRVMMDRNARAKQKVAA